MLPLWFKLVYTVLALGIVVIYWVRYGPGNLLWFCDLALIGLIAGLWLESSLLISTLALSVLVPELVWNLVFFARVIFRVRIAGVIDYMFEPERPALLKALSLFHVPLPFILVWAVWTLGYDPRALLAATAMAWIVLPLTWLLTPPERNVNWVHGPGGEKVRQQRVHPLLFVAFLMLALPIVFYLPAHFALYRLVG